MVSPATAGSREGEMTGRVMHFEIPVDDEDRAFRFYAQAFGWHLESVPGMSYTLVSTGPMGDDGEPLQKGYIGGGMMKRQAPITSPVITVACQDIDSALKTVADLGGEVVQGKAPVGDAGFTAYVRDTEGNVIGLWQDAG
jgi:predicted enzyme related to lactoylglutathione lyase